MQEVTQHKCKVTCRSRIPTVEAARTGREGSGFWPDKLAASKEPRCHKTNAGDRKRAALWAALRFSIYTGIIGRIKVRASPLSGSEPLSVLIPGGSTERCLDWICQDVRRTPHGFENQ